VIPGLPVNVSVCPPHLSKSSSIGSQVSPPVLPLIQRCKLGARCKRLFKNPSHQVDSC